MCKSQISGRNLHDSTACKFFWNPRRVTDTNTVELTADKISLYMHIEHLTSADCTQVAAVQT